MSDLIIQNIKTDALKTYQNNARVHDDKQVDQLVASISEFNFTNPILVDETMEILCGHGRLMAAQKLQMESVPVIVIDYLDEAQKKAYRITDNQLTIKGKWDENLLGIELESLSNLDLSFDLSITGFETSEIDLLIEGLSNTEEPKSDEIPVISTIVSKQGDVWKLGKHRIICGNALDPKDYERLMSGKKAQMIFTDPPYNVPVKGHISSSGKHKEFAMASGEMTSQEFTSFLKTNFENLVDFSVNGSLHYICMDWRHIREITLAGGDVYSDLKNLCVWAKDNGGMGSLYRSRHELIFVYKNGKNPHTNNIELGKYGRYRTNVWEYAGANSFSANKEETKLHPTVKPTALVSGAILDVTKIRDIVLDSFLGSGTTLIACEKTNRICYGMEIEPLYIDTTIQRWQTYSGQSAIHEQSGKTYHELCEVIGNE